MDVWKSNKNNKNNEVALAITSSKNAHCTNIGLQHVEYVVEGAYLERMP